ncbi:MAG: hypothetical protein ACOCTQ_02155 [Planctomycetota bacterium]
MFYRRIIAGAMLVVAVIVAGCSSVDHSVESGYDFGQVNKTAVVDVSGDIRGKAAIDQTADLIQLELMKKGYSVIEREKINEVIEEQEFQHGEATQSEAVKMGEILNVPAIVMANTQVDGASIHMTIKMIDTEGGQVLWVGSGSKKTGGTLTRVGGAVAGAAVGVVAGGSRSGRVAGGIAGGVLGGAAGDYLAPEEKDTVKKVTGLIVDTLPAR